MNPSLTDMVGDYALLEFMLLAAGSNEQLSSISDNIDSENLQDLVNSQSYLLSLRAGSTENWQEAVSNVGEDRLAKAIRIEAWKNFQTGNTTDADSLLSGIEILENAGIKPADSLSWAAISGLVSANREAETIAILGA